MLGNEFDINVGLKKRRKRRSLKNDIETLKQKSEQFFEKILQAISTDDDVTDDSKNDFFSQNLRIEKKSLVQETSQGQLSSNQANITHLPL